SLGIAEDKRRDHKPHGPLDGCFDVSSQLAYGLFHLTTSLDASPRLWSPRPSGWHHRGWIVNRPVLLRTALNQRWTRIDREGATRDGQHRRVVDRVSEDCIGRRDADAIQRGDLAFVGRYVNDDVRDDSVLYLDACGKDVICRDPEAAHTLFDHPIIG